MEHKPTLPYSGLAIILSNASRFDTDKLLSGHVGTCVEQALRPLPRQACYIATWDTAVIPNNTSVVLVCGSGAMDNILPHANGSLLELRGSPLHDSSTSITYIPTFSPQDAFDLRDYESKYNPALADNGDDDNDDGESSAADTEEAIKGHGKTRRGNWRFWLLRDVAKAVRLTTTGPYAHPTPNYIIHPEQDLIIHLLNTTKGRSLYFDIETTFSHELTVFSFSFGDGDIYTVPVRRYTGEPSYGSIPHILRALAVALRDNEVVIHNSLFDLFILARRYGIPFGRRIYDTMLAHHRLFPEVEKSLGHCLSLYTDLPYHKNEGVYEPHNYEQEQALWLYNAKDVYALTQLRPAIDLEAHRLDATSSIAQANAAIGPYLTMMLHGIRFNNDLRNNIVDNNTRRAFQVQRILRLLTGVDFNPNSPQQVSKFLYDKAVGLGIKRPIKDPTNEKTLFKILTKQACPPITLILEYRRLIKEAGLLKFTPWQL